MISTDSEERSFLSYGQSNVLAVGSGPLLVSLVAMLFESGIVNFHVLITESVPTDRGQLANLLARARQVDPEAIMKEIPAHKEGVNSWRRPYDHLI